MPTPRLLLLSRQGRASLPADAWSRLTRAADVRAMALAGAPAPDEAARLLAGMDLLGATNACLPRIDDALLDAAPRLRGIVLYATGHDHVDTALLARRGVGLAVLPDYATVAVAEHTVALMLALSTRLHLANDRCRGRAPADVSLRGVELAGRTLGIVGLGRIGRHVARLGAGLGMRVLGADPDPAAADAAAADGIATTGLGALLTAADVVAVCASHRYGAPPVLGAGELAAMRPGAWLVNAARAALVDTDAVTGALRRRHLRGYAVDDHLPGADPDLVREGRLLQTGHSAWWRDEVLRRGARMWGDRLVAAARGVPMDVVTWPGAADLEECVAAG